MEKWKKIPLDDRIQYVIVWLMRLALVVAMVWTIFLAQWSMLAITALALVLTWLPALIESGYKVQLPVEFDLIIVLFVFAGIFLGEVGDAYSLFWWWDAALHTASGVVLSFGGFLILYTLYYQKRLRANPITFAIFTFAFGMAAGGIWEIFEYTMDELFGLNMQKSGLHDTMSDLIVDAIGSLAVSIMGYRYVKNDSKGFIAKAIQSFLKHNPQLKR